MAADATASAAIWVPRHLRHVPPSQKGATMANATKPAPPAPATTHDTTREVVTTNGTTGGFDWAALDAPIVMPNKATVSAITANVLETVPEQIRKRAEASLALNTAACAAKARSSAKRARVVYRWDFQPITGEKMAQAFDTLITKYAKYRPDIDNVPFAHADSPRGQVTARTGAPGWFVMSGDSGFVPCKPDTTGAMYGLRFSVRPFEHRKDTSRLPGTE